MSKFLSLCAITALSLTTLSAEEAKEAPEVKANNFSEIFSKASLTGELRAIYQTNSKFDYLDGINSGKSRTGVLGGKVGVTTAPYSGIDLTLTGYGTVKANGDRNKIDGDYVNNGNENKNYALLGQAFIRYKNGDNSIQAGRFELDTPMLHSDDIRLVPNLFQGIYANVSVHENLSLQAGYINRMAGWENAGNNAKFEKFGKLIDSSGSLGTFSVDKSSISFVGLSYGNEESPVNVRLFDYLTKDVMNQIYTDVGVKAGFVNAQAQYLQSKAVKKLKDYASANTTSTIDSNIKGAKVGIELKEAKLGFSVAYNKASNKSNDIFGGGTPDLFGGANDALFTSMDVLTANQMGGVKALKAELTVEPIEKLSLSLAHAQFKKNDGFKDKETDLGVGYEVKENVTLEGMVSKIVTTDTVGDKTTNNRARLALKVGF